MIDCASCKYRKDSRTSLWCQDCLKKGKMYFNPINESHCIEVKSTENIIHIVEH